MPTHSRVPSTASISCHSLVTLFPVRPPSLLSRLVGHLLLFVLSLKTPWTSFSILTTLSRVLDLALNYEDEDEEQQQQREEQQVEDAVRSLSMAKRRKCGRKGEGMTPLTDHTQTSERLTLASQTLVRELSLQTRLTSAYNQTFLGFPPDQPVPVSPTVTKKQRRWKLSFGKSRGEATVGTRSDSRSILSHLTSASAQATNVTNLIMAWV